jgi:hypothetical protein
MSQLATVILSALAVVVSGYALYISQAAARNTRDEDTIRSSYDEFEQLSRLRMEHWKASHLLEMPENYAQAKQHITFALTPLTEAARHQMLLCERAVATQVFDVFEETYYYRERAKKQGDHDRVDFLDAVLNYFTGRLLANPRLRWLWSPHGGNLCAYFESETIHLYDEVLSDASQLPVGDALNHVDPTGPYLSVSDAIVS